MMRSVRRLVLVTALVATGCTSVAPTNPYDTNAPASQQAKARLSGTVVPEAAVDLATAKIMGANEGALGSPDTAGRFSIELAAGSYDVSVIAPNHEALPVGTTTLAVGEHRELGYLRLMAFHGSLAGTVTLAGVSNHAGSVVSATPGEHITLTDASGAFSFAALPVGDYSVTEMHTGFATKVHTVSIAKDAVTTDTVQLPAIEGDFSINGGATYTSVPGVSLDLVGFSHPKVQASESQTFADVTTWADFATTGPSANTVAFTLSSGDGHKTVYVRFSDDGVTPVQPLLTAGIVLDATKPAIATMTLDQGTGYSNDAAGQVTASFVVWDALSGVSAMKLTTLSLADGATVTGDWEAYVPFRTVVLPNASVDGTKRISVVFRDAAGNQTDVVSRDVLLKRDDPSIATKAIVIDDAAAFTRSPLVTLTFGASGAALVQVGDESSLAAQPWQPYPTGGLLTWALPLGDGVKTVYARFRDVAGNTTAIFHDDITLDTVPPTVSVALQGTAAGGSSTVVTRSLSVTVKPTSADALSGIPASAAMQIAFTPDFAGAPWGAPVDTVLQLAPTEGPQRVYVRVKDLAGNTAVADASITYDQTPPYFGGIVIDAGATYAASATGRVLSLSSGDALSGVLDMCVSESAPACTGGSGNCLFGVSGATCSGTCTCAGSWERFNASKSDFVLAATSGAHTVYAQYRDAAGNASMAASATITLDLAAPTTASFTVDGFAGGCPSGAGQVVSSLLVALALTGADDVGVSQYQVAEGGNFGAATWLPWSSSASFDLSAGSGAKTVSMQVRDAVGHVLAAADVCVVLDMIAPSLTVALQGTVAGGAASTTYTRVTGVTVKPTAADALSGLSPTAAMQISSSPDFTGAVPSAASDTAWGLVDVEGLRRVYVKVTDRAGNSAVADAAITYDKTPPYFGSVVIDGGAAFVSAAAGHTLSLSAGDALSGVAELCVSETAPTCVGGSGTCLFASTAVCSGTCACAGTWEPFKATKSSFDLTASAGTHAVYAQFRDAAGNASLAAQTSTVVDLAAPTTTSFTVNGYAGACSGGQPHLVTSGTVALALTGTDDTGVSDFKVAENQDFGAAVWQPWTSAYVFTLSPANGAKSVSMKVRDSVGRELAAADVCVTLDDQAPSWVSLPAVANPETKNALVSFNLRAQDNVDVPASLKVAFAQLSDLASWSAYYSSANPCAAIPANQYQAYAPTLSYTLNAPSNGSFYTVYACLEDSAGNIADPRPFTWPTVHYVTATPTALSLNAPVARASGVLLSWTDPNQNTATVGYSYCFAEDFNQVTSTCTVTQGSGSSLTPPATCVPGVNSWSQPPDAGTVSTPSTLIIDSLKTYRTYVFVVWPQDCATNQGPATVTSFVTPALGERVFADAPGTGVTLFSDGVDLWAHYPSPTGYGESLLHCNAASHDCRNSGNWATTLVLPTALTGKWAPSPQSPPAMFADENTVFMTDTFKNGSNYEIHVVFCARNTNCELAGSWDHDLVVRSSATIQFKPGAAGTTDRLFGVAYPRIDTGVGYMSITRCARRNANHCRTVPDWSNVDFKVPIESNWYRVTAMSGTGPFWVGYTAENFNALKYGMPAAARCEDYCDTGDGGTCADGYKCGDLRYNISFNRTTGVSALPPVMVNVSGTTFAAWRETTDSVTETVKIRSCAAGYICLNDSYFYGATSLHSQAFTGSLGPQVTLTSLGAGVAPGISIRAAYVDSKSHQLLSSMCDQIGGNGCVSSWNWTGLTLASGPTADVPITSTAVGQNFFLSSINGSGQPRVFMPIVAVPYHFFAAPQVGQIQIQWTPAEDSAGTKVNLANLSGPGQTTVTLRDPFTGSLVATPGGAVSVTANSFSAWGEGVSTLPWTAQPFKLGTLAPPGTTMGTRGIMSIASAPGDDSHPGDSYIWVLKSAYDTLAGSDTWLRIGRCSSATDCSLAGSWSWAAIGSTNGWVRAQLTADYPRNWAYSSIVPGSHPRLLVAGHHDPGGGERAEILGCDTANDCLNPSNWDSVPKETEIGYSDTAHMAGDLAMMASIDGSNRVVVRFCDGLPDTRDGGSPLSAVEKASNYCFDHNNPGRWVTTELLDAASKGGSPSPNIAAAVHPTMGFFVAQGDYNGGIWIWTCPYQTASGAYTVPTNNCNLAASWKALRVPAQDPGAVVARALDIIPSKSNYYSMPNGNDEAAAIYVSYRETNWYVASCFGLGLGGPASGPTWDCANPGASNDAKNWGVAYITPGIYFPKLSAVRVVNGDVILMGQEAQRLFLATCPKGGACYRDDSWRVTTARDQAGAGYSNSVGFMTSDDLNQLHLIYPETGTPDDSLRLMTAGRFTGP